MKGVRLCGRRLGGAAWLAVLLMAAGGASALERLSFSTPGASKPLAASLRAASLLVQADTEETTDALDLFSAARSDYSRILSALYADGYYGGTISIRIDGREAADIAPVDAPDRISRITVTVQPGRQFHFSVARMRPYAPGTRLPPAYGDTKIAHSTAISDAAAAGIDGWRRLGHAKAAISGKSIVADHRTGLVQSEILLDAGPRLTFGRLDLTGYQRMRPQRIAKIAGYRGGEVFDPEVLDKMADRLRQTGIFRSVIVAEADNPRPDGSLDIGLAVVEQPPRRFGVAAEASTADGANLSAFWLHRNLFGGGERLRFDGVLKNVDAKSLMTQYEFGVRLERPATPVTDSTAFVTANVKREDILGQDIRSQTVGLGLTRTFSKTLYAEASIDYTDSTIHNVTPKLKYRVLSLPVEIKWDRRDDLLDARKGSYMLFDATPFLGFGTTDSGAQLKADVRGYKTFGTDNRITLAGRVQLGTVVGSKLLNTAPDFLFYSGGGGTVRGQPYDSLGVTTVRPGYGTINTGGLSFIGLSGEVRATISDKVGAAVFYDAGFISPSDLWGKGGSWHSGAGFGIRYDSGLGPIRLDIAFPTSGKTSHGTQVYVGIGQAF